jgi:hypothetical protein
MSLGPIEILCIKFPNASITSDIATALKALVDSQMIRIVDILFIRKDVAGEVSFVEIDEMNDIDHSFLDPLIADIAGLISDEDVLDVAQTLENNTFAAILLFEHTWATVFRDAVLKANGQLLLSERIPHSVVEAALATAS